MLRFNVKLSLIILLNYFFIIYYFLVNILLIIAEFLCTPLFFYLDFITVIRCWLGKSFIKKIIEGDEVVIGLSSSFKLKSLVKIQSFLAFSLAAGSPKSTSYDPYAPSFNAFSSREAIVLPPRVKNSSYSVCI